MSENKWRNAKFICAPRTILEELSLPKEESFPNAFYIWPYECERFHCFRIFELKREVIKVEAAFQCDNLMDVWINGKLIVENCAHLKLVDITNMVQYGENQIHIRGYQTSVEDRFSSALTGGIRIFYLDGDVEEIVTDNLFKKVQLVDFWETEEPEGFEIETKGRGVSEMNVMQMHPIALRRSFYFVRTFELKKKPVAAHLKATALGCYEPYLNGKRVCDCFFIPFGRNYKKEYQDFDVLSSLHVGKNTVGFITGNGTYNCLSWGTMFSNVPEVVACLEIIYEDGEKEYICTDEIWRCYPSPLIENDIQYGERYDANLEIKGWSLPNVDLGKFVDVSVTNIIDDRELLVQNYPYIRKIKEYPLLKYTVLSDGTHLYDVGVCIAGRVRCKFKNLRKRQKIRIRFCERLNEKGLPEQGAYTQVHYQQDSDLDGKSPMFMRNMDVYIANGEETESYECRFAYTGFRYVWVEGLESLEQLHELVAYELHNDLQETGEIFTDHKLLNQIFQASKRSWLNNIFNGPTDCPTREKNFWNGDSQIFSHAACWMTNNSKFLERWTENGIKMHDGPYAYEDEIYELPLTLYRFYGNRDLLRRRYPEMLKLIEKRQEFDGMILPEKDSQQYCDWLSPTGITPNKEFYGGCWYYHMLVKIAEVAKIVGDIETSRRLFEKASMAREEFNKRHLVNNGTDYDAGNQCGLVLTLAFGIAPDEKKKQLAKTLVHYIEEDNFHLSTGFIGTRYLFDVLADYGYGEIAYKVITNETFPSWAYMLSTGATAITESWLGAADPDRSLSMAHFSLGSVVSWFFEYLGGIRIMESEPGMKKIVLKPVMLKEIGQFSVSYQSELGEIRTEWHFEGDKPVFNWQAPESIEVKVFL